jgi:alpha-L-fucosidase
MSFSGADRMRPMITAFFVLLSLSTGLFAQHAEKYFPESDPLVQKNLERWQDLKFGLLMHWGPYSQWGVVESWSICAEDEPWCRRNVDNYIDYKKDYETLPKTFNPVRFDPDRWAAAAREAGMKYVVFTTKHHDGFCMFDTKQTDYRITSPDCPFSSNPRANITREVFSAFRSRGFMIGAYFSKPDWHSPYYWWPNFATPDRNVNYSITGYPDRWRKFVGYTHQQIGELLSEYGRIDILWLDGGWVQPLSREQILAGMTDPGYKYARLQSQDIDMPRLVQEARARQPGLIVVDRAVEGPYQNYLTPEARIPEGLLPYPWETCMPMATSWSYVKNDRYKSTRELIHMLVEIVAKGGNFLLNIGPGPDGEFDPEAYRRLAEIGAWMRVNGEALYGSRPVAPHRSGDIAYTMGKDGTLFAIVIAGEADSTLPARFSVPGFRPADGGGVTLLGSGNRLPWEASPEGCTVMVPEADRKKPPSSHAWVLRITRPAAVQR